MSLMVKEQYLESCSVQLAIFLRERKPKDLDELAVLAQQYLHAHANRNVDRFPMKMKPMDRFQGTDDRKFDGSIP